MSLMEKRKSGEAEMWRCGNVGMRKFYTVPQYYNLKSGNLHIIAKASLLNRFISSSVKQLNS